MNIDAGKIRLTFEASELMALHELARKHGTDVGTILRIGGLALLDADRRGLFKIEQMQQSLLTPPASKEVN